MDTSMKWNTPAPLPASPLHSADRPHQHASSLAVTGNQICAARRHYQNPPITIPPSGISSNSIPSSSFLRFLPDLRS
ncbi:hypothetical protein Csa_007563 [Cucumis sativus]|uniref:Uncharacterized protein n=1 Tax=Cucumis sativus TaxID=3659 RepID=A0A0A0LZL0_CUCSA|nr:hypothetical protein Csa_007563 [Cucumis sativus]